MWCSACTVVTSRVQCLWFWCLGRCEVSRSEGQTPPDPKGWTCAAAAPDTLADLLGARAERVPDCSSYLSRIPGSATDSGSSIHPRNSVDRPAVSPFQPPRGRLHALLNASAARESTAAGSLKAASSNASAASESTTAGGLEAFSQSSAGAERFENASSKFRWNPSPLLPLM